MKTGTRSGLHCVEVLAGSRGMIQQLVELDESSAPTPWDAAKYRVELSKAHMTCMAATLDGKVVGYAMVRVGHLKATVTDMLVHVDHRRQGVGRQLLRCIDAKLLTEGRRVLELVINERRVDVQNFLKACGIKGDYLPGDKGRDGHIIFWAGRGFSEGFKNESDAVGD